MRKMFDPGPVLPGDAILTAEDLRGLCEAPNEELQRQIEEGRTAMNAMTMPRDWERRGANACQLLYARLIAGILPPEEKEDIERLLMGMIECGGWPLYKYDIKLIRLAIIGCGFAPGRPLRFNAREQTDARASS
jgi:hypothetical protein